MAKTNDSGPPQIVKCPSCGGHNISGLMAAFWVWLSPDGLLEGDWNDWNSDTELSESRMCRDCKHEFECD